MGYVICPKHGGQIGSLTSNRIDAVIAGKAEINASDMRSVFLSLSPNIRREDLTKRNVFDKEFLRRFELAEDDDFLFIDDQNPKHVKLADDITIVCGRCLKELLEKIGHKR
jgi:hypothetical protein